MEGIPLDILLEIIQYCPPKEILYLSSSCKYLYTSLISQESVKRLSELLLPSYYTATTLTNVLKCSLFSGEDRIIFACEFQDINMIHNILSYEYENKNLVLQTLSQHGTAELIISPLLDLTREDIYIPCLIRAFLVRGDKITARALAGTLFLKEYYEYLYSQGDYEDIEDVFTDENNYLKRVLRNCFVKRGDIEMLKKYPPYYHQVKDILKTSIKYDKVDIFKLFCQGTPKKKTISYIYKKGARNILNYISTCTHIENIDGILDMMVIRTGTFEEFVMRAQSVSKFFQLTLEFADIDREKKLEYITRMSDKHILDYIKPNSTRVDYKDLNVLEKLDVRPSTNHDENLLKNGCLMTKLWIIDRYSQFRTKEILLSTLETSAMEGKIYIVKKMLGIIQKESIYVPSFILEFICNKVKHKGLTYTARYMESLMCL